MDPKQLRKHWRRALDANLERAGKLLRQRGPLDGVAIHALRVALRRSRLLLQLWSKHKDRQRTKRFRAAARQALDALAPVRDCDVALEWALVQPASPELLGRLWQRRSAFSRQAQHQLSSLKADLDPKRLNGPAGAAPTGWGGALTAGCPPWSRIALPPRPTPHGFPPPTCTRCVVTSAGGVTSSSCVSRPAPSPATALCAN
jgi:hypothetical protein